MYRLYNRMIEMMRRAARWPLFRATVPQVLRRNAFNILHRRQRASLVRAAFSGRDANLQDIESFVTSHPVSLEAPLVLISQAQRSGGTLLSQLFDGHPALAAHPQELKIGYPRNEIWPPLNPAVGANKTLDMIYEANTIMLMKRGYTKGDRDPRRRRFFLVPRVQQRLFQTLFESSPPSDARAILNHFFTAYFNAWLNYQGNLEAKRWVTAFAPRLAHREASVEGFFEAYPDGRLVQILREPNAWYVSARNHRNSALKSKSLDRVLEVWRTSADSMLRNRSRYGDRVIVLRFEDLIRRTESTMRALARELDIAYDPILAEPTFNGEVMHANSSFAVAAPGVIDAPLSREKMLSENERRLVEEQCGKLYTKVLDLVLDIDDGARSAANG